MLTPNQVTALSLSVSGLKVNEVAKAVGVSRMTLSRWFRTKEFRDAYNENVRCLFRSSQEAMLLLQARAVEALKELLDSKDEDVKYKAVKLALNHAHCSYLLLEDIDATAKPYAPNSVCYDGADGNENDGLTYGPSKVLCLKDN